MKKFLVFSVLILVIVLITIWAFMNSETESQRRERLGWPPIRQQEEVVFAEPEQKANLEQLIQETKGKLQVAQEQNVPKQEIYNLYVTLGLSEASLGNLASAKDAYLKAAELFPDSAGVWAGLFPVYRDMYDYDRARDTVRKVLSYNPFDWNMWRNYIELERYQFKANKEELNRIFQDALEKSQTSINVVTLYARFLEENGDYNSAFNYWKIALEQQPDHQAFKDEINRLQQLIDRQ